jgi:hypothetical protein
MSADDRAAELDVASAETTLPIAPPTVAEFIGDVGRLLRLNPLLAIECWEAEDGGYRLVAGNESNGHALDTLVRIERAGHGLSLRYESGLKQATQLRVEAATGGTRLVVTEHYPRIEDAQDPRFAEVDKSLVPWVAALRRHLLARARWGRLPLIFPLWQWWNERVMLSMVPRNRRIVRLLIWLSVAEFLVFILMVAMLRWTA